MLSPIFTGPRRKRLTVNRAVWQSLQVCSEAEKCCNKQVLLPSITPFILRWKCSGLLALLSVKSPSSCLTLLQEHDRYPCHSERLQQSDAPNLSFRQVNLWIIYFYVLSKYVDSSQLASTMQTVFSGGQASLPEKLLLTSRAKRTALLLIDCSLPNGHPSPRPPAQKGTRPTPQSH